MNLNQVTLPATNMETSLAFYQALGLKLIVNAMPHYVRFVCPDGQSSLSLHPADERASEPGITIYFECDRLEETVSELRENGLKFDQLPRDESWLWKEAIIRDPAGNKIKLYFAGANRLNPPWRV